MPAAALFHFGTRAGQYETNPRRSEQRLRAKARRTPPPAAVKRVPGQAVALPRPRDLGSLSASLKERRTWRNFSNRPVALDDLSTLLQLTFGVQHQARIKGQGDVVLKTSPSAGARHPLEAYVLARNVAGLRAGVYHYNAAGHALVSLHKRVSSRSLGALLADQRYFDRAGAVVVMAAVFERSMWKYPSARAYRAILIDAGHLGQTFCVLATALGLAPFSTMAFREAALDRVIGVDGVRESAMYVVGVGTRGKGAGARPGRIRNR
jgi:SagB-type dehydrogenase family enzyme